VTTIDIREWGTQVISDIPKWQSQLDTFTHAETLVRDIMHCSQISLKASKAFSKGSWVMKLWQKPIFLLGFISLCDHNTAPFTYRYE
jgi:hypothetical protein